MVWGVVNYSVTNVISIMDRFLHTGISVLVHCMESANDINVRTLNVRI